MKNKLFPALVAIVMAVPAHIDAQALCPGSGFNQPDNLWYNSLVPSPCSGVYIDAISTAMIDFPGAAQPVIPAGSLIASVFSGNGTAGGVCFTDVNSGFTVRIPFCGTPDYIDRPGDIILGNDQLLPLTDFRAAASFYDMATGFPKINYYKIHYTSATTFTAALSGSTTFAIGNAGSIIHLDVIADAGNTGATGFPWCNDFIVTWDDLVTGICWAHKTSLGAPTGTVTPAFPTITLPLSGAKAYQPDVAAIQRRACVACPVEQIGLFAVHDGLNVLYTEYNWTTGTPSAPTLHPAFPFGATAQWPRIDAPDDYTINDPTTPGLCYYKIATEMILGLGCLSTVYDNIVTGGQDDGAFYAPYYTMGAFTPTVAYGGNGGTQYQVLHYLDSRPGNPGTTPGVYMEPINWMFPASTSIPDFYGAPQWFYRVNTANPIFTNGKILNSISTPCNNPAGSTLCAWADHDNTVPNPFSSVYYKITTYGGASGYTFKPGENNIATAMAWKVYPSPAATELTIESPPDSHRGGSYKVTDVLGRQVLQGALQAGSQKIAIHSLAPGSYIISTGTGAAQNEHTQFIKQ